MSRPTIVTTEKKPNSMLIEINNRLEAEVKTLQAHISMLQNNKTHDGHLPFVTEMKKPRHTKQVPLGTHVDALSRGVAEVRGYSRVMGHYGQLSNVVVPVVRVQLVGELGQATYHLDIEQPKYAMDVESLLWPWFQPNTETYLLHTSKYMIDNECGSIASQSTQNNIVAQLMDVQYKKGEEGSIQPRDGCKLYKPNSTCKTLYEYVASHPEQCHPQDDDSISICAIHGYYGTQLVQYGGHLYYVRPKTDQRKEWTVLGLQQATQLELNMTEMLGTFHRVTECAFGDMNARNIVVDKTLTLPRLIDFETVDCTDNNTETEKVEKKGTATTIKSKQAVDKKRLRSIQHTVRQYASTSNRI